MMASPRVIDRVQRMPGVSKEGFSRGRERGRATYVVQIGSLNGSHEISIFHLWTAVNQALGMWRSISSCWLILLSGCGTGDRRDLMRDADVDIEGDAAVDDAGTPDAPMHAPEAGWDGATPTDGPDFATLFATVLYPRCSGCHQPGRGQRPDISDYDAIVERASMQVPGRLFVVPGDADASYVYRKVAGSQAEVCTSMALPVTSCGERMPFGTPLPPPLPEDELALVRAWIQRGAPR